MLTEQFSADCLMLQNPINCLAAQSLLFSMIVLSLHPALRKNQLLIETKFL